MEQGYINYIKRLNDEKRIIEKSISACKICLFSTKDKYINDVKTLQKSLLALQQFCGSDCPNWVREILIAVNTVINNQESSTYKANLFSIISTYEKSIINHSWEDGGINIDFDFENIYSKYKKESKLNELLDEVISLLKRILEDESLKDDMTKKQIQRLLGIIKNNSNKSFYSDEGIITCLFTFVADIAGVIINIPGLGEILKDLIKLIKSLSGEMDEVKNNMSKEIEQITKKPTIKLWTYDASGFIKQIEDKTGQKIDISM